MDNRPVIDLNGRSVRYSVRRSHRAKRLLIHVDVEQGLVIVVPRRVPLREVEPALRAEADWILKHLERFGINPAGAGRPGLVDGQQIPFVGEKRTLRFRLGPRSSVRGNGRELVVTLSIWTQDHARRVLEGWLREQARKAILDEVSVLSSQHGFGYSRLFIRDQKTRWGSCSKQRSLSFSWRLVLTPPNILRYVVAHELAHLKEWGHTPAFWRLVESICPDHSECRQWLNEHGPQLRF